MALISIASLYFEINTLFIVENSEWFIMFVTFKKDIIGLQLKPSFKSRQKVCLGVI